jgi:glycosyltransferase involved in cell wall biosynthesis
VDALIEKTELKVALVHEWFESYAGSERVLEQLLVLFPQADIYSLVDFMPPEQRALLGGRTVHTSFIQNLPFARRRFRNYLGLMPIAIEQFSMEPYDLVISSSHAVAKGVITGPNQVHISYVHSPMRYAWDMQAQYLGQGSTHKGLKGLYARWLLHRLRMWDVRTAPGVDVFVANSNHIAQRIRKVYRRGATVVHPPVDVDRFELADGPRDSYLIASRFVPYKRVDLVVEAFRAMPNCSLTVVGSGTEETKIRRLVHGAPNITLLPPQPQETLIKLIQQARAFVCAAEEDFGIGMVEAQACGTPLIAFGRGGACDILDGAGTESSTGMLFEKQNVESIIQAVRRFETIRERMTPARCRANALRFSRHRFLDRMLSVVEDTMPQMRRGPKDTRLESSLYAAELPAGETRMPVTLGAAE